MQNDDARQAIAEDALEMGRRDEPGDREEGTQGLGRVHIGELIVAPAG
jgi:hypothetical protein